jgi:tellurite resistance protein
MGMTKREAVTELERLKADPKSAEHAIRAAQQVVDDMARVAGEEAHKKAKGLK